MSYSRNILRPRFFHAAVRARLGGWDASGLEVAVALRHPCVALGDGFWGSGVRQAMGSEVRIVLGGFLDLEADRSESRVDQRFLAGRGLDVAVLDFGKLRLVDAGALRDLGLGDSCGFAFGADVHASRISIAFS